MRSQSVDQGILRLVISLVLLTSLTILANVWFVTYQQAQTRLAKDIELAEAVLGDLIADQEALLVTSASVLTDDFGFKQAIATGDDNTIVSALHNHGRRIDAELMAIFSLSGQEISSIRVDESSEENAAIPISENMLQLTLVEGGITSFLAVDGRLYKTILLRIDAPRPVALGMVGFELNSSFVDKLAGSSQLHIKLTAESKSDLFTSQSVSDSKQNWPTELAVIDIEDLAWHHVVLSEDIIVKQTFTFFEDQDVVIRVELTQDLGTLIKEFSTLKTSISIITFLAVILACIVAIWYSKKLARPISELANAAIQIASGNYRHKIETSRNLREINTLSHAFEKMQVSISEREKEIRYQAEHDSLTHLFTRYHAGKLIDQYLRDVQQSNKEFQAIGINIEKFRSVNDLYGMHYGDQCLVEITSRIKRLGGLCAMLSGGEFLWIPSYHTQLNHDEIRLNELESIKHELEKPIRINGVVIRLSLAMSVVYFPSQASNAEELFKRTNLVLDEAKQKNSKILQFKNEYEEKYSRRIQIITKLKQALIDDSSNLSLFYQPKLHLPSQQIGSAEALIRWIDQDLGFVPPDEFIQIAENAGLINQVTDWVINRAISDAKAMQKAGVFICIAINLSARDIENPYLLFEIKRRLEVAKLPQDTLSFEITESDLVDNSSNAIEHLQDFKSQGYSLAIDDFGTGYSSLSYLKRFPVDTLKIDKSFVLNLSKDKSDKDIVVTIMMLAKKFNLSVVAEGVEDKQSLEILHKAGCTWVQGYFVCRPIALHDFMNWIQENEHTKWLENV